MKTIDNTLLKKSLPIILIFILTIVFFYPALFQGKTFYAFDTLFTYLPWSSDNQEIKTHNLLITDPVNIFYTHNNFIKKCLDLKILSGWDSSNFCGITGKIPTHPVVFFSYLLFSQTTGHDLILWIHLIAAGIFMFLYLRQIQLKTLPALIGAVAWMFNGYVMVWFEFENVLLLSAPFAAALYFFELWLKTRRLLHCLCIACAISLSMLVGCQHLLVYQFIFFFFYLVYRYFLTGKNNHEPIKFTKKDMINLGVASMLILCISSGMIIDSLKIVGDVKDGDIQRREFSFKELYKQTGEVPDKYLTTLIFPDFFGNPAGGKICFTPRIKGAQPYNNYNELCIYAGILTLFLGLACIPYLNKRRYASFYLLTGAITLAMAMGSILYYPLAKFIPGLNLSTPTRIIYIFGFCMSVLAAIGADILLNIQDKKKWLIIALWSLLLGTTVAVSLFVNTETGARWAAASIARANWDQLYSVLQKHFSLLSGVILKPLVLTFICFCILCPILFFKKKEMKNIFLLIALLILTYDLMSFGLFYNTASPKKLEFPKTGAIRFLETDTSLYRVITFGNFFHNAFVPFNIDDVGGYASFYPKRYGEFLHLSQYGYDVPFPESFNRWIFFRTFGSPLLDLINTKYLLLPGNASGESETLKIVYDNEIKIYENKNAFKRAFFVTQYEYCDTRESAYKKLATYNLEDFKKKVILENMPPENFHKDIRDVKNGDAAIDIISYTPKNIEIDVKTDQDGFLVISDNYHPGWRAKVDGQKTDILRANYIMRAIPLKSGEHKVILEYYSSPLFFIITVIGWFILCGLIGFLFFYNVLKNRRNE